MDALKIQYNVQVNQAALMITGIIDDVDAVDMTIFDCLVKFRNSTFSKKMNVLGHVWFQISWKNIVQQLPIIKIKSRVGILKRLNKLKQVGLILPHPDNGKGGPGWYRMTQLADRLQFISQEDIMNYVAAKGVNESLQGVNDHIQGVTTDVNRTGKQPFTGPVNNRLQNNNTNSTKSDLFNKSHTQSAIEILNFYGQLTGFKISTDLLGDGKEDIAYIVALLNKGHSVEDIETMITFKVWKWKGTKYEVNLNTRTLFFNQGETYILQARKAKKDPEFQKALQRNKRHEKNGQFVAGDKTRQAAENVSQW